MTKRRIGVGERRARLGSRHHLAPSSRAGDLPGVARDLVGLHGSDPASAYVSAAVRTGFLGPDEIGRVLYDERAVVRMLAMRRTMFYVPVESMPMLQAACADAIAVRERKKLLGFVTEEGLASDPEAWLIEVEAACLRALDVHGEATTAELSADEPLLRTTITLARGKPYEAKQSIASRVLFLLAAEGRLVRGRPLGSWLGSQHRWATTAGLFPSREPMERAAAQAELVRGWLQGFGPGTLADLKWYTGLTMRDVKAALTKVGAVEVDLDGEAGLVLPGDVDPVETPEPWVALLPGLDPTPMGWANRAFYLSDRCRTTLFDRNGNIGPSIWVDGEVVGGWAQREDGSVHYRLIEKVDAAVRENLDAEAGRLEEWFGGVRAIPRFRTPLEKELSTPAQ